MDKMAVNGTDLQYEVQGSGEPVLLIGTGPIADSFVPFFSQKALSEGYRLIRYRQRRIGRGQDCGPVSFEQHAADAAALLSRLGVRRSHVAGHSTGANIALQLAAGHPETVQTLALLEPALMTVPAASSFFESVGPALSAYESGDKEQAMAKFLSVVCTLDWDECRKVIEKNVPGGVDGTIRNADNFFQSYLPALSAWQFGPDEAAAISRPVLSVLGTETNQLFVDGRDLLHRLFPRIQDCTIEGIAHLLHMQQPEPVAHCVADFFARHPLDLSAN